MTLTAHAKETNQSRITKCSLKAVLSMAQSDRGRELIPYTAFVSGNFSQSSARKQLGLDDMKRHAAKVESSIQVVKDILESIDELARMEIENLDIIVLESDSDNDGDLEVISNLDETTLDPEVEQFDSVTVR